MTISRTQIQAWMVLSDSSHARLIRCSRTTAGHVHFDVVDKLELPSSEREHGRPCSLAGMTSHAFAAEHHTAEEDIRRFSKQLAQWIDKQIKTREIDFLTIFTPARALEALRTRIHHAHRGMIELRTENLFHLSDDALLRHEAIQKLITQSQHRNAPSAHQA